MRIDFDVQRLFAQGDSLDQEFAGGLEDYISFTLRSRDRYRDRIREGVAGLKLFER